MEIIGQIVMRKLSYLIKRTLQSANKLSAHLLLNNGKYGNLAISQKLFYSFNFFSDSTRDFTLEMTVKYHESAKLV